MVCARSADLTGAVVSEKRLVLQDAVQLPDLETDQPHVVRLFVPVTQQGQVHLSAKLQYCTTQVGANSPAMVLAGALSESYG